MPFLKKLGQIVQIVGRVAGFIPLAQNFVPQSARAEFNTGVDKLNQAMNVLVTVEQTFTAAGTAANGADKLKAATPFVAQLIQQSDLLVGKHPKDEAKFTAGCTQLTSALADILNSFE